MSKMSKFSVCVPGKIEHRLKDQAKRRGISLSRLASQAITTDKMDLLEERQKLWQKIFTLRAELAKLKGDDINVIVESARIRKEE